MKRLVLIAVLAGALLGSLCGPAAAAEDPSTQAAPAPAQVTEPDGAEAAPPAPSLEELLTPPAAPVCSCKNRCSSDAQCELLYGPGSQCVPVGSCQCRICTVFA
ncbi:MAG: hypothetical protein ACREF4_06635 [Gammaproteobacteria bacterium]